MVADIRDGRCHSHVLLLTIREILLRLSFAHGRSVRTNQSFCSLVHRDATIVVIALMADCCCRLVHSKASGRLYLSH